MAQVWIGRVVNYLPNAPDSNVLQETYQLFVSGLSFAIQKIVQKYPNYTFLAALIGPMQQINLIAIFGQVREVLNDALNILVVSFGIGLGLGTSAVIVVAILSLLNVKSLVRDARRGKYPPAINPEKLGLYMTEEYVGMHVWHFVLMQQLVMWPVVLVCIILSIGPLRDFLFDKLWTIILSSIGTIIVQKILQTVVIKWYLTDGHFMLRRPELMSVFHFGFLVVALFAGLMRTFTRWVMGLGFFSVLFGRLDMSIYPGPFAGFDAAFNGFLAMVIGEARNSNPVLLTFVAVVQGEHQMRRIALEAPVYPTPTKIDLRSSEENQESPLIAHEHGRGKSYEEGSRSGKLFDIDRFVGSNDGELRKASTIVYNLTRCFLRSLVSEKNSVGHFEEPLEGSLLDVSAWNDPKRAKKEKLRNKWWLYYLLSKNPSLIKTRKHQIYIDTLSDGDANEGFKSS